MALDVFSVALLLDDLDDPSAARLDQNRAAVDDRVAVIANAIFLRYVVIGDAFFRQDGADPQIFAVLIRRAALFDDVTAEARTLVDAEDAVHAADDTTDDPADRTGGPFAVTGAPLDASGDALRLYGDRQRHARGNDGNSDETADHD